MRPLREAMPQRNWGCAVWTAAKTRHVTCACGCRRMKCTHTPQATHLLIYIYIIKPKVRAGPLLQCTACCARTAPRPGHVQASCLPHSLHTRGRGADMLVHTYVYIYIYIYIIKPKVRAGPLRRVCAQACPTGARPGQLCASSSTASLLVCASPPPPPPPIYYHPSINDTVKMHSTHACAAGLRLWRVARRMHQAGQTLVLHRALVAQPAARAVHSKPTQHAHMGPSY